MTQWIVKDARRLHRRLEHLAAGQHPPSPQQIIYLRTATIAVLTAGEDELPPRWQRDLYYLLAILEEAAAA